MLLNCVFVGLGGAAGSICRYLLGLLPLKPASGFPAITLCINIAGAFALGLIGALAGKYAKLNPQLLLFLRVGGVRRLHHLLCLFRGDGRSAAKRKDRPCDAVYGAEPAVVRDGGAVRSHFFVITGCPFHFDYLPAKDCTPLLMNFPAKRAISSGDSLVPS